MTIVATVALAETEFVLGRVLADTDAHVELVELVPVEEDIVPYFWATGNHDSEAFLSAVDEHELIVNVAKLDQNSDRALYRLRWKRAPESLIGALVDNEILVDGGSRIDGEWLFKLFAPDNDAFSGFREDCAAYGVTFDIRTLHYDPGGDDSPYGLTEKQREALELAFEHGYFEIPREATLVDLAAATDISQQAFSRRLQRAQRDVFGRIFPLDS